MKYFNKINIIEEQFYGLLAQVSTGLPQILIIILISNKIGLLDAGLFGIFIGYIAVIYSISYWGIRNTFVLGTFEVDKSYYYILRIFFIIIAGFTSYIVGFFKEIDHTLIYFIIFVKSVDSLLEIDFGFNQIIDSKKAQKRLALLNIIKLLSVLFFMILFYYDLFFINHFISLIFFSIIFLIYLFILSKNFDFNLSKTKLKNFYKIFMYSTIFMIATASCSLLTNLPRISLEKFYDDNELGIAGICLSVSTFFGMIFNVNWQKYFSKYKTSFDKKSIIVKYVKENILLFILSLFFAVTLLPFLMSFLFGFSFDLNYNFVIMLLSSFLIFALGMNFLNIFKLTSHKYLESVFYILTFVIFYLLSMIDRNFITVYNILLICGISMIIFSFFSKPLINE